MSWIAASSAVLLAALAGGAWWYERTHPSSRVLALVATLAALAALGRVAFAPLPNVKPTTDVVLLAGFVLGGAPGFAVGAVAALTSNLFFGQGPWTPWQMVAWGLVGLFGAGLGRLTGRRLGRIPLALACALAGLAFGAIMNLHLWVTYSGDHAPAKLAATFASSLPFDLAHALGNLMFCLAFGPALVRALARYRTRFEITWLDAPPAAGAATLLAVVAALAGVVAAPARAASADAASVSASLRYLLRAQNPDGGWGAAPGQSSSPLFSGWAALGIAAAGRSPRTTGRTSAAAYVRRHTPPDLGSQERTLLVLAAARLPTRDAAARLARRRARDGSFAHQVNLTAFGVLALRAAGRGRGDAAVRGGADWIARQANPDGGFNFGGRGGPSGVDDTGAAVQALAAAGRRGSSAVRRAAEWLAAHQNADGGFPLQPGADSNAQSTAWAVQGLIAAGRDPAAVRRGGRDPLGYLRSLTAASGAVRYSRTSRQTPVWVTAQAVMALAHRPLPIAGVVPSRPPERPRPAESSPEAVATAPATPAAAPPAATATATAAPRRPSVRAARPPAAPALLTAQRAREAGVLAGLAVAALP